jgi:hypothetical protein
MITYRSFVLFIFSYFLFISISANLIYFCIILFMNTKLTYCNKILYGFGPLTFDFQKFTESSYGIIFYTYFIYYFTDFFID